MTTHPTITGDELDDIAQLVSGVDEATLRGIINDMPTAYVQALTARLGTTHTTTPPTPLAQAQQLDPGYRERAHLTYLSNSLAEAVARVEAGENVFLMVEMPPRYGKTRLTSIDTPTWILRKHPDWRIGLISHSPDLAASWGRDVRRNIEENSATLGITVAPDAGAVAAWQTTERGGVTAKSIGQRIAGFGFKVLMIDDPTPTFAAAHSEAFRNKLWDWYRTDAFTRLEPPYLVVVIGTRFHEADLQGRLLAQPDAAKWKVIRFPAIAEDHDVLGRAPGEPLLSPLVDETPEQALDRLAETRASVGEYTWAALYQQRPAPAQGAIFNVDRARFWTLNPAHASRTEDGDLDPHGQVRLTTEAELATGRFIDSWDCTFKGAETSDFVVGQRWVKVGPDRFLIAQRRGRWSFTETLAQMEAWTGDVPTPANPFGDRVHERIVEETANGVALIEVMSKKVAGVRGVNPHMGKEARARTVTPEWETGNVLLPYPNDPGNEWVNDLLSEMRSFPMGHDDQVDSLTQALGWLRDASGGFIGNPAWSVSSAAARRVDRSVARTAAQVRFRR